MPDESNIVKDEVTTNGLNRRQFLRQAGVALGAAGLLGCADEHRGGPPGALHFKEGLSIVRDPTDPVVSSPAGRWAVERLNQALNARGVQPRILSRLEEAPAGPCIVAAGAESPLARRLLAQAKVVVPQEPESLALLSMNDPRQLVLACGRDARGMVYALTELADRVEHVQDLDPNLSITAPIVEHPTARIRGIMRCFTSDVEDKPWYNDRDGWKRYLSMLITERFNRLNLAFGIGYDFTRNIKDAYFYFAYPFLLSVPGYDVRATNLPDTERDSNLSMLKFISDEAVARGLHFQLGIWTHAYQWTDSPNVNHNIEGLTAETHANYCRDALKLLLQSCPSIGGITFRIHGESGVPEGNYDFWKTVFDGIVQCGRKVQIDLHAKGIDQEMIDVALNTGMPVTVAPKTWAEHMGLPYHQAAIRPVELPRPDRKDSGFFAKSSGSRSFLRYGYGDLLKEDRKYGILHRTWPGTQRLLLWGDPAMAAGYANFATFCGSDGLELFEPLSFKGRKGSGLPGGRDGYKDRSLKPKDDWEKYAYSYRLWGRLLYNPQADPQTWRRITPATAGFHQLPAEEALAEASRILPLITTAHCPSAANNNYWPEIYTNMSIVDDRHPGPYGDTPSPKRFGAVSPLDPELFSTIDQCADELIKAERSCKYSPLEVAQWLRALSTVAEQKVKNAPHPGVYSQGDEVLFWRLFSDVLIQCQIGSFFASKFEAGVLWAIYLRSGDPPAGQHALARYKGARDAWKKLPKGATGGYVSDITYGLEKQLRGNWSDRLPAIEADIALMEARLTEPPPSGAKDLDPQKVAAAIQAVLQPSPRPTFEVTHRAPAIFRPGDPLGIDLKSSAASARLHYRHVNQAEAWHVAPMEMKDGRFIATIPGDYTNSPYPLQYYLELRNDAAGAMIYPGLDETLTRQPYIVVRSIAT